MNGPLVDENLYVCTLRSGKIPYNTRQTQLNQQSNRDKQRPNIPPGRNSLQINHKINIPSIQTTP